MKETHLTILFFIYCFSANTQSLLPIQNKISPTGGGEYIYPKQVCLTPAERTQITHILEKNRAELVHQGKLQANPSRILVSFEWPVANAPTNDFNNSWAISNFVDQDLTNGIEDYDCGTRSYDGHKGIDIFTWPYPWHLKDNELVYAVAGADGTIIGKADGNADDHCSCLGTWNAVYIEHADGSIAWYGHLKTGSLTPKIIGETVTTGEYLGVIASSGCSTGPHLHFEVYDDNIYNYDHLIDPFSGPCNDFNASSWWADQLDYRKPKINAALTHDMPPVQGCPSANEFPHFDDVFLPGETLYTAAYFKDQLTGTTVNYELLRPNGSSYTNWSTNFVNTYDASWWYNTWALPNGGPFGTWTFTATYQGETIHHTFQYLEEEPSEEILGVGINTTNPKTELHVHDGALYIDNAAKGIILKGENGSCYMLKIDSSGTLVTELMDNCPE